MTIKEVEQLLEVPRATIRFYEKENLIKPVRESNGYRDYSEYDVGRLKQIILLRKIGFSVTDIEDVLDEARALDEVLEENTDNEELESVADEIAEIIYYQYTKK